MDNPGTVRPLFSQDHPQQPVTEEKVNHGYIQAISAALDIASARILGLLAVAGAVMMFAFAVYDPIPWRVYAVGTYAAVVLWPLIVLYLKKG